MRLVGNLRIWWDVENCFGITLLFLLLLLLLLSANKHLGPGQLENKHGGNSHNPILALQQTDRDAFMRKCCRKVTGGPQSVLF